MTQALVSVIIPFYEVEEYIEECLKSVAKQTFLNLEIICVNDGSRDESRDIVRKFVNTDKRFRVIDQANGGLSDARNTGIDIAKGDYLFLLDSDDVIASECIQTLVSLLETEEADLAVSNYWSFDNSNNDIREEGSSIILSADGMDLYGKYYEDTSLGVALNTAWGKLYKRELFNEIRYPKGVLHEDEFVTYKLFAMAKKAIYTSQQLYGYRQRAGSIMSNNYGIERFSAIDAMIEKVDFFITRNEQSLLIPAINECFGVIIRCYRLSQTNAMKKIALERYKDAFRRFKEYIPLFNRLKGRLFYYLPRIHGALSNISLGFMK